MAVEYAIKTKSSTPPGGWRVTVPETGKLISHYDWQSFINAYEGHLVANNIPMASDYEDVLLDRMCRENMPAWKDDCKGVGPLRPRNRPSFGVVMTFLSMARRWVGNTLSGSELTAPQEEANERARICSGCPLNVRNEKWGCGSCTGAFEKTLAAIMGGKSTPSDGSIGSCGICGCSLKVAVHVPLQPQWDALSDSQKDDFRQIPHCWKKME